MILAAPTFARAGVMGGFILDQGNGLTPTISLGVLFAQEQMYRPTPPPDQYTVAGANWTNTQYAVASAQWLPGIAVTLPKALAQMLGLQEGVTSIQLPALIYTIGDHTIEVGQTVSVAGIVQAGWHGANIQGYNATGTVISVNPTQV